MFAGRIKVVLCTVSNSIHKVDIKMKKTVIDISIKNIITLDIKIKKNLHFSIMELSSHFDNKTEARNIFFKSESLKKSVVKVEEILYIICTKNYFFY